MDWVLIIFATQVITKKRPVRPVFPDYLSVSYDYARTHLAVAEELAGNIFLTVGLFPTTTVNN